MISPPSYLRLAPYILTLPGGAGNSNGAYLKSARLH